MIPFIIKDMCAVLYSSIAQLSQKKKKKKMDLYMGFINVDRIF